MSISQNLHSTERSLSTPLEVLHNPFQVSEAHGGDGLVQRHLGLPAPYLDRNLLQKTLEVQLPAGRA